MHSKQKGKIRQIEQQKAVLLAGKNKISLTTILNREKCQALLNGSCEFRERIYSPCKTIFTFIKQVLSPDKSCKNAVSGVIVEQLQALKTPSSSNTGPYCKARKRLPEKMVRGLVQEVGRESAKKALTGWKPYGRELKTFDGSTVKMSDTKANQEKFPQHKNQARGAGFPIARLIAVMSLTTGTVIDYAVGACKGKGTGEQSLLRKIFGCIDTDDIVLGDGYFPSFFVMLDLKKQGADGIFRGQSQRHYDFRKGKRLGKNDHVVKWKKPTKPEWMDSVEYESYPVELEIREFKVAGNIYVTTFLAKKYPRKELAKIYELRGQVELNLRSIKAIMNMDMLSCKTPEMIQKEIGIHFLAYNFIRIIICEACVHHDGIPWKISFKGTVQLVNQFMPYFLGSSTKKNKMLYGELLNLIVKNRIGNRPGRFEPRVLKQRPKAFPTLKRARRIEKLRLKRKIDKRIARYAAA